MNFFEIFIDSLALLLSFNEELYEIILLSLSVSGIALLLSTFFGLITAFIFVFNNFYFKKFIIIFLNSCMGIPPVVVGLIVFFLFVSNGPFGVLDLLYTPYVMIIAQIIIIFPIISSLSYELFKDIWVNYKDLFRSYNIPVLARVSIILRHSYFMSIAILMSGFSRAISEVGAIMIVGGNIEHYTRAMTTAISYETRLGNLEKAMAIGIVLIIITFIINYFIRHFNLVKKKEI